MVFLVGGTNGAISGSIKSKIAAMSLELDLFQKRGYEEAQEIKEQLSTNVGEFENIMREE